MGSGDLDNTNWGGAAQGAMGGAAAGAAFGPWGALIGGGLGGAMGLFGGSGPSGYQDQLNQLANQYANRQAPQLGGYSDFRKNQAGLIAQLEGMARGQGPSAAAIQMREAMDRAAGAQASAAAGAGGRGVNQGAALRQAANNTAAVQAQGARDTATLRSNEQMGAIGQLGQVTSQARAQDDAQSAQNLQAKLQTMGINDQDQLKALMMAIGVTPPALGQQLMAGGASAAPMLMQWQQMQKQQGAQNQPAYGSPGWYQSGGQNDFADGIGMGPAYPRMNPNSGNFGGMGGY
jgi:hypothetical protein